MPKPWRKPRATLPRKWNGGATGLGKCLMLDFVTYQMSNFSDEREKQIWSDSRCFSQSPKHATNIYLSMPSSNGFSLPETIAMLARTPASLDALLRGLPDTWVHGNEGRDTWSAFDIVGHLIFGERTDWIPRARRILEDGEARPFDPFDRFAQFKESEGKSMAQLLDEFARLRGGNVAALQAFNLQAADLARRGTHPALGVVTLSQLLATWAVHDLTHLHQLSRVMAHQYASAVGPWSAFLGVLHCDGHSAP